MPLDLHCRLATFSEGGALDESIMAKMVGWVQGEFEDAADNRLNLETAVSSADYWAPEAVNTHAL